MLGPTPDVPVAEVAARVEQLLPGHLVFAAAESARIQRRKREIVARTGRALHIPDVPPESAALGADHLVDDAVRRGLSVARRRLGEDFTRLSPEALLPLVLGDLAGAAEDIFAVDLPRCRRIPAGELSAFVRRPAVELGDVSFAGDDEVFVCTVSPRIIVLHHEGWVFDVRA